MVHIDKENHLLLFYVYKISESRNFFFKIVKRMRVKIIDKELVTDIIEDKVLGKRRRRRPNK